MNFNNLKHVRKGESVFDALLQLGGTATYPELLSQISKSTRKPENVIELEVKQVLRTSVVNGYLERQGKSYVLSRSCRTWCTDSSGSSKTSGIIGRTKRNDVRKDGTSFTTFGFPKWWNRFWNRLVVVKEKKDDDCTTQGTDQNISNSKDDSSTEINVVEPHLRADQKSTSNNTSTRDLSVTIGKSAEIVAKNLLNGVSQSETQSVPCKDTNDLVEIVVTDSNPTMKSKNELKLSASLHSIISINDSTSDLSRNENWLD